MTKDKNTSYNGYKITSKVISKAIYEYTNKCTIYNIRKEEYKCGKYTRGYCSKDKGYRASFGAKKQSWACVTEQKAIWGVVRARIQGIYTLIASFLINTIYFVLYIFEVVK